MAHAGNASLDRTKPMELTTYSTSEPGPSTAVHGVRPSSASILPVTQQDAQATPLTRAHGQEMNRASVFSHVRLHQSDATGRIPDFQLTQLDAENLLVQSQRKLREHIRRDFNPQQLQQFYAARDVAMRSMTDADFDQAIDAMLKLYADPDADIETLRGKLEESWKQGGVLYGLRSIKGRAINLVFPVLMPYLIKHWSGGPGGIAAASINFAGTLAAGILGMERDADFLLHVTPAKDLQFKHGAPNIAQAMKEMSLDDVATPQQAAKKLDALMSVAEYQPAHLQELYRRSAESPHDAGLREQADTAYRTAETALRDGMLDYQCASLFGKVWDSGGLQNQCWLQATRMYANMAATWSAFESKQPISGWFVTGTTLAQAGLQPVLARGDQVREQYGQMRLYIAKSTPGKGEDFLRTAWRSYEQIGQQQFLGILKEQSSKHIPKAAATLLHVTEQQWGQYRELELRQELAGRWTTLDSRYRAALDGKDSDKVASLRQQMMVARDDLDAPRERELSDALANHIGMAPDDCWEHHKLTQWNQLRLPLTTAEQTSFDELHALIQPRAGALTGDNATKYDKLHQQYEDTVIDQQYTQELKFDEISRRSGHAQAAASLMDPELKESFRNSPAFLMGFMLDGDRRANDYAEYGSAIIAGVVRTYQAVIANPGGAVLVGSLLTLITEISRNKDHHYHETPAHRSIGTDIMACLHLLNIAAVSMIALACSVKLGAHVLQSSAGQVSERVAQNFKLITRDLLRARGSNDALFTVSRSLRNLVLLIETGVISINTPSIVKRMEGVLAQLDEIEAHRSPTNQDQSNTAMERTLETAMPLLEQVSEEMRPGGADTALEDSNLAEIRKD